MSHAQPRIVVTDYTFPDLGLEEQIVRSGGCEFIGRRCQTEAELIDLCADADAVITQFARLTAPVIGRLARARAIVRYGVGFDNVDVEAARSRGIPVCNVPDYCVDEVADQTLAFILALTRQILPHALHLREGRWGLAVPISEMKALRDLTVGIIGFGRIGHEVVQRLVPFKCRVLVLDPVVPEAQIRAAGAVPCPSLEEFLPPCDLVSLHCPSTPVTRRILRAESFALMKPGAAVINVGRGDLVDSAALLQALQAGTLAGAALDVFDPEPIPAEHPIRRMPNVLLAPHIASVTPAAVKKLRETAAWTALRAVRGEPLKSIVNGVVPAAPRRTPLS